MNPHIQIISYFERIDLNNIEKIFDNYSVVIDGSDNFPTRFLVNDACILLGKTLIHGSILSLPGRSAFLTIKTGQPIGAPENHLVPGHFQLLRNRVRSASRNRRINVSHGSY